MRTRLMAAESALAVLVLSGAGLAQNPVERRTPERTITVSATGTMTAEPDRARVHLSVESLAATATAATEANTARMERLVTVLRGAGLGADQIRTVGFELYPEYARERPLDQQEPRIVGYRARNTVQLTIDDVRRVGTILDDAIGAGANRVAGLWFELRDPAAARAQALRDAVTRARGEAEAIAGALGEPLGPALDVSTTGVMPMRQAMPMLAQRDVGFAEAVPIEPGQLEISVQITAVYRIGAL